MRSKKYLTDTTYLAFLLSEKLWMRGMVPEVSSDMFVRFLSPEPSHAGISGYSTHQDAVSLSDAPHSGVDSEFDTAKGAEGAAKLTAGNIALVLVRRKRRKVRMISFANNMSIVPRILRTHVPWTVSAPLQEQDRQRAAAGPDAEFWPSDSDDGSTVAGSGDRPSKAKEARKEEGIMRFIDQAEVAPPAHEVNLVANTSRAATRRPRSQ